ncbi:hypothetical protein K8S19_08275 [bacterium]|nr:hypothetical protein [bacterium]
MGKKQRSKKEKTQQKKVPARGKSSFSAWVVGSAVFFAVVIISIVGFVQLNKARFIKISVMATSQTLESELRKSSSRFTMDERDRLAKIIYGVKAMVQSEKKLDPKIGGHLMFVLKVCEEITREGKLAPGELEKLEMLLSEAQRILVLNRKRK